MYHILLCDSELSYIDYMETVFLRAGIKKEQADFQKFVNGKEMLKTIEKSDEIYDLLITDICIHGIDGLEAAERFRQKFPHAVIVFCSGVVKPTDRSFKVLPYRYLYKEYTDEKMLAEIREVLLKMQNQKRPPVISAHNLYNQMKLNTDEILYIQIAKRGSRLILRPDVKVEGISGDINSNEKLPDLYRKLRDFGFEYAHNSYIVNLKYVKAVQRKQLVFMKWEGEEKERILSVSRSCYRKLLSSFVSETNN